MDYITSLPPEIIQMIIEKLDNKKDLRHFAAAHRVFCAASLSMRRLYTRDMYDWILKVIWKGDPVRGEVDAEAIERVRHALRPSMPRTETEYLFPITTIIPRLPDTDGDNEFPREEYQFTLLHIAAWLGFIDLARALLQSGADINAMVLNDIHDMDYVEHTPVFLAAANCQWEMVKLLGEKKAHIGRSLLWMNIYNCWLDYRLVSWLFDRTVLRIASCGCVPTCRLAEGPGAIQPACARTARYVGQICAPAIPSYPLICPGRICPVPQAGSHDSNNNTSLTTEGAWEHQ
ncbi:Putative ankyrin repeat-containing domain superfamily [Colletotrichum destructivum]|uniref:Ankyrin repeat-containing domain superfamily n=1 Tax=Colletotrichum destructivum TaxID=34406 RepID=A0AAX4I0P2_9PEZI|nr:Putative ankyrin repeat-containing domain superfamily [Colletotrichum destructivum]